MTFQGPPADSVRAVLRDIFASPAYEWTTGQSLWTIVSNLWRELTRYFERLAFDHPVGYFALMFVLVAITVLLFTHMGFVISRALRRRRPEALPDAIALPKTHDAAWHLAEARRLAEAGRFADALGHRFEALVHELERRRAVSVRASRTPAEYAREARLDGQGRQALSALVTRLYATLFGGRPCSADDFAMFDREASALVHHAQG